MQISLIANSGIQFHKLKLKIDPNKLENASMAFHESEWEQTGEVILEYAYKIKGFDDVYTPKVDLQALEYLDENDNFVLDKDINLDELNELQEVDADSGDPEGYYRISDILECLDNFENTWLPFPYFKQTSEGKCDFGPLAWSRIYLKRLPNEEIEGQKKKKRNEEPDRLYEVILAFDTKIANEDAYFTPRDNDTNISDNIFIPNPSEDLNLDFCNEDKNCGWVRDYIRELRMTEKQPKVKVLKYIAEYLYLLKFLATLKNEEAENVLPSVSFFANEGEGIDAVDVDLVLDIGNSNTCGLLFENPENYAETFDFKSVKKLELFDLSENVGKIYSDPFSMRLAFAKAEFGQDIEIPEYQNSFKWVSLVRVGKEAQHLINKYNINDVGDETPTNNSSPKRYLWDNKKAKFPWEFVNMPVLEKSASISEITAQFDSMGEYTFVVNTGPEPYYSRKSLMTLVYIEIFLQAMRQVNSHEFREDNEGTTDKPRKIRRVVITCPTSIVQKEQIILRQCAIDAAYAIKRYYENTHDKEIDPREFKIDIEIVPSPKELSKNLLDTKSGEKNDWIYDEATCSQLVFLYAELSERYLNNSAKFFDLYGKRRDDVDEEDQKSITIASIDIGGGTTDMMIAAYEYAAEQSGVIKPKPLFWDSYITAGDDLMYHMIKEIIIEGNPNSDAGNTSEAFCNGAIKHYAKSKNCERIQEKLQNFFGVRGGGDKTYHVKGVYQKNFTIQIAIPIIIEYLKHAQSLDDDRVITYDEIFKNASPHEELINFINSHFGNDFDFKEIKWLLSKQKVFDLINQTFEKLFKQLSVVMSAYGCDFVLLSGRITSIDKIREIFIKYYPVSPDRIISLNKYRVGRWYPTFGKEAGDSDLGYFKEPKTIVAVGAIIALMAGKFNRLSPFNINTEYLIKDLVPATEYIGQIKKATRDIDNIYLSPSANQVTIDVKVLPLQLGFKQLISDNYLGRPIYKLQINEDNLRKKLLRRHKDTYENAADIPENLVKVEREKIEKQLPFKIKLKRNYRESKEEIIISNIQNKHKEELGEKTLELSLMTLPDEKGYWLDTGEFSLGIDK